MGVRAWVEQHPRHVDALIAGSIFVVSLTSLPATPEGQAVSIGPPTPASVALLAVSCGALLWRRTAPVAAWTVSLAATMASLLTDSAGRGLPATVAALYALAAYGTRRQAVVAAVVTMAAALFLVNRVNLASPTDPVSYAVVAWCGLAAALGDAARSSRALLRAALERAQRAERGREEEAERRVTEERLRISRELHDVVAHHVAVVNVHAGVAEHLAESDPAKAKESMRHVRAVSSQALAEMGGLVRLLRAPGTAPDREPAPGSTDLAPLVEGFRAAGADVSWRHTGPALEVAPEARLHVYRIVQEALTNATRHGAGPIELVTRRAPSQLVVEVTNAVGASPRAAPARGDGHGLTGMRERASLLGADLVVDGPRQGRFRVVLSVPVADAADPADALDVAEPADAARAAGHDAGADPAPARDHDCATAEEGSA